MSDVRLPAPSVISCSQCLRVLRGSTWVEARDAIRQLRSFELPAPPRLQPALCDRCTEAIVRRRGEARTRRAA